VSESESERERDSIRVFQKEKLVNVPFGKVLPNNRRNIP